MKKSNTTTRDTRPIIIPEDLVCAGCGTDEALVDTGWDDEEVLECVECGSTEWIKNDGGETQ